MKKFIYKKKKNFLKFYNNNKNLLDINSIIWFYLLDKIKFLPGSFLFVKPRNSKVSFKIRRSNNFDLGTLNATFFHRFHKPPILENFRPKVIMDFGSNIGSTLVDFAVHYPEAKIYGFEMDAENFSLAKYNTNKFSNIEVKNIAIWVKDETIFYDNNTREDGYQIAGSGKDVNKISVRAMSILGILKENNIDFVDYVKMDIEGSERDIFFECDLDWLNYISVINIELHNFNTDDITLLKNKLALFNFRVIAHVSHWSSLYAIRNDRF